MFCGFSIIVYMKLNMKDYSSSRMLKCWNFFEKATNPAHFTFPSHLKSNMQKGYMGHIFKMADSFDICLKNDESLKTLAEDPRWKSIQKDYLEPTREVLKVGIAEDDANYMRVQKSKGFFPTRRIVINRANNASRDNENIYLPERHPSVVKIDEVLYLKEQNLDSDYNDSNFWQIPLSDSYNIGDILDEADNVTVKHIVTPHLEEQNLDQNFYDNEYWGIPEKMDGDMEALLREIESG